MWYSIKSSAKTDTCHQIITMEDMHVSIIHVEDEQEWPMQVLDLCGARDVTERVLEDDLEPFTCILAS